MEVLIGVVCFIAGFCVAKFWRSRKVNATFEKARMIAKDPSKAVQLGKEIGELWN